MPTFERHHHYPPPDYSAIGHIIYNAAVQATSENYTPGQFRHWPWYLLVYIEESDGGLYQGEGGVRKRYGAGDFILHSPGQGHVWGPDEGTVSKHAYVAFAGPLFDMFRARGVINDSHTVFQSPLSKERLQQYLAVVAAPTAENEIERYRIFWDFVSLLCEVCLSGNANDPASHWLNTACKAMRENPRISIRELARESGLSERTFRDEFKAAMNATPVHYRIRMRISKASELLAFPDVLVKDVANQCGFPDEFTFSKAFKRLVGISPSQYRDQAFGVAAGPGDKLPGIHGG